MIYCTYYDINSVDSTKSYEYYLNLIRHFNESETAKEYLEKVNLGSKQLKSVQTFINAVFTILIDSTKYSPIKSVVNVLDDSTETYLEQFEILTVEKCLGYYKKCLELSNIFNFAELSKDVKFFMFVKKVLIERISKFIVYCWGWKACINVSVIDKLIYTIEKETFYSKSNNQKYYCNCSFYIYQNFKLNVDEEVIYPVIEEVFIPYFEGMEEDFDMYEYAQGELINLHLSNTFDDKSFVVYHFNKPSDFCFQRIDSIDNSVLDQTYWEFLTQLTK